MEPNLIRPGEVAGWPKLVVTYPTDPERIAALLPPGLERCGNAEVQISVYCVPVHGEPEYGVSIKIPAAYRSIPGWYTLGIGIDQESAIFISRDTNGQPKYPCSVRLFRLGDSVHASATHQGVTFLRVEGRSAGPPTAPANSEFADNEWWIKVSRAVGEAEGEYDLEPRVVRVAMEGTTVAEEPIEADVALVSSAWDPVADLLPPLGPHRVRFVANRIASRTIAVAGPLDPVAFWPWTDTIGGSRWPGTRGGPIRAAR